MGNRAFEQWWNTNIRIPLPWRTHLTSDRYWGNRQMGDSHGPQQYVELQAGSHVLIEEVVRHASRPDVSILDLGCNVGRHLNALHKRGYTNLYGVDVQKAAIEQMERVFPDMRAKAHIEENTFQEYLPKVPDRFFEVVFTFGATIELVSPSFPICQEMARTAAKAVVLAINESGHAYPRLWETEFRRAGFKLTKRQHPLTAEDTSSLLVFQPMT